MWNIFPLSYVIFYYNVAKYYIFNVCCLEHGERGGEAGKLGGREAGKLGGWEAGKPGSREGRGRAGKPGTLRLRSAGLPLEE